MTNSTSNKAILRRAKFYFAKNLKFKAICKPGFEKEALFELNSFGVDNAQIVDEGTILIEAKYDKIFAIHPFIQTIVRFKLILLNFKADTAKKAENHFTNFPWELFFEKAFEPNVHVTNKHCRLFIKDKTEESIKWGIKKHYEEFYNEKKITPQQVDQTIFVYGKDDEFEISIDLSGDGFYKKGLRLYVQNAPMRESDAAAILYASNFYKYDYIIDPMCGSALFSIEATSISKQFKTEKFFPFMNFLIFKKEKFNFDVSKIVSTTTFNLKKCYASDINEYSVKTATANLINSNLLNDIDIQRTDFFEQDFSIYKNSLIIINPPYGKRIAQSDIVNFYKKIIKKLNGQKFVIIIPHDIKTELRIKADKEIKFINGGIPTTVLFFC